MFLFRQNTPPQLTDIRQILSCRIQLFSLSFSQMHCTLKILDRILFYLSRILKILLSRRHKTLFFHHHHHHFHARLNLRRFVLQASKFHLLHPFLLLCLNVYLFQPQVALTIRLTRSISYNLEELKYDLLLY